MTDRMEERPPRMRLYKILDGVIPSMYRTPCKIAIFADGQRIKVFEKVCFAAPPDLGAAISAGTVPDAAET